MRIDLRKVSDRMVDLENDIPQAPNMPDDVPVAEVLALMAGIDPKTPGLDRAILREVGRARNLSHNYYAARQGRDGDDPAILGAISFLQGVTFARAVADVRAAEGES